MTRRPSLFSSLLRGLALAAVLYPSLSRMSRADGPPSASTQVRTADPAVTMIQALQANPLTGPYRFTVRPGGSQYVLSGRVGSKLAHDAAIRTMIALGYPVRDDLTIDTREAYRAAAQAVPSSFSTPYVYPPPIMGRLDDPFYGFEPPLVSYPPFALSVAAREPINLNALANADPSNGMAPGTIQMDIGPRGVATLRGRVPTAADRVGVGEKAATVAGVTQVVNLIDVMGPAPTVGVGDRDVPPPPPTPARLPLPRPPAAARPDAPPDRPAPERAPVAADGDPLARRVAAVIARRPALTNVAQIRTASRDGVVTLTGQAPSAYEAMIAFRAAQQTPGVRDVIDKLEYPLPDTDQPNPLRTKGRAEDAEPYLLSQVRRQVGDLAHVDQLRLRGDSLDVSGTVSQAADLPRVEATLRSIPLLRGFRLETHFVAD